MNRLVDNTHMCVVFLESGVESGNGRPTFGVSGFLVADGDRKSLLRCLITTRQAAKTLEQGEFHV